MLPNMSGEPKIQEIIHAARGQVKCGIPQRLSAVRQKETNSKANYPDISKPQARPRSASQTKDDLQTSLMKATPTPRLGRPEKERPTLKRPSTIPRRVSNNSDRNKTSRPVITVPVTQKQVTRSTYSNLPSGLPSQEVIEKCEELELKKSGLSDTNTTLTDFIEGESITSRCDKFNPMKLSWQEKLAHFERMKKDLTDRQAAILEVYSALRNTHQKLKVSGQKVLPPSEELRIMNVAELTPEQMLQLCNITDRKSDNKKGSISIDINKLYNMPSKLIESCEQTLFKRKEIIDWFENLKSQEKGITRSTLSKKVEEFNAENEMMKNSLELAKVDFFRELNQIIEFVRKSVTETIALQLQAEELNYALSDLDSQNDDLRKQIHHLDHLKSHTSKGRVEELEKELKEERCKKIVIKERLTKAEGQMKIGKERASQLEAALEQARSQTWNLERTVQQLQEQNQKLQHDFDREFSKLTESIKENTMHLEEIADARKKLQTEKEDLEKRLGELSEHYNESIKNMKHEMNINIAKLIDTEKKYEEVNEDKKLLESKVESLCAQLLESQLTLKDTKNLLEEKDLQLINSEKFQKELEITKTHLEAAKVTVEEYEQRLNKQSQAIEDIERNLKETVDLEETLKNKLSDKDEYISELEKKQILLEEQLQESELKMEAYEDQLSSLKNHISQLQKDFGEFENLNDLHVMINQQTTLRAKLLETTRQNGELAEALQKKELELEQHLVNLAEQESHLEQREGIIKMLTQKEEEQANIIKLLRNDLESRAQADANINQQMMEKNYEMDSLLSKYETSQQTISQLEKIILALEDENCKASQQRRKEQAKIRSLEDKIAEYETISIEYKRSIDTPSNNLDNFIKILEDELGTGIDNKNLTEHEYSPKQIYVGDYKRSKLHRLDHNIETKKPLNSKEHEKMHTKVILEKTSKKKYEYIRDDQIGRKTGATNIGCQKVNTTEQDMNTLIPPSQNSTSDRKEIFDLQKKYLLRNVTPQILKEDKKIKMFKFAGHRI